MLNAETRSSPFNSVWTDQKVSDLKTLCQNKSLTARMIAAELRVTRNSVMSKCRRCGIELPGHRYGANLTTREKQERADKARGEKRAVRHTPGGSPLPRERYDESVFVADQKNHVGILELTKRTCRWPYGESPNFQYCGAEPVEKNPYCPFHHRIAYSRAAA